jgi:hypothetical protein
VLAEHTKNQNPRKGEAISSGTKTKIHPFGVNFRRNVSRINRLKHFMKLKILWVQGVSVPWIFRWKSIICEAQEIKKVNGSDSLFLKL